MLCCVVLWVCDYVCWLIKKVGLSTWTCMMLTNIDECPPPGPGQNSIQYHCKYLTYSGSKTGNQLLCCLSLAQSLDFTGIRKSRIARYDFPKFKPFPIYFTGVHIWEKGILFGYSTKLQNISKSTTLYWKLKMYQGWLGKPFIHNLCGTHIEIVDHL